MGYITKAVSKLFYNNNEKSKEHGKISALKVCLILLGINGLLMAELTDNRHEKISGDTQIKPSNVFKNLFDQEHNVQFVANNDSCSEKYVTAIVENYGSHLTIPRQLFGDQCNITKPSFSNEAIEQFHGLNNKSKFRVKYVQTGGYQKIYSVADYGSAGHKSIVARYNTLSVTGGCALLQQTKVCNLPKIHRGTYDASFIIDQDNNVIKILQLEPVN